MNYFNKSKLVTWLVIFLIIINITAIFTIVFHIYFSDNSKKVSNRAGNAQTIIRDELMLSPDQEKKYLVLNKDYDEKSFLITSEMETKRSEMLDELSQSKPNKEKLNNIAQDIGNLHTNLKKLTIENFLAMKNICDSNQCKKLRLLFNDMQKCEGQFCKMGKGGGMRHRYGQKTGQEKRSKCPMNQDSTKLIK